MSRQRVSVTLTIEIDLAVWREEYNIEHPADVRNDIRSVVAGVVQRHLRDELGFPAVVRPRNTSYRPARMRS